MKHGAKHQLGILEKMQHSWGPERLFPKEFLNRMLTFWSRQGSGHHLRFVQLPTYFLASKFKKAEHSYFMCTR